MEIVLSRSSRLAIVAGAVVIATLTTALTGGTALAKKGGPKLKLGDACSFVTTKDITTFGKPVKLLPIHFVGTFDCVWDVAGGPDKGGGRFQTFQLFPNYVVDFNSAHAAFVDERSIDSLANARLVDRYDVGKAAFVNYTSGQITVEVSPKFAFTLLWVDADPKADLRERDVKKLVSVAKKVVQRGPK